MTELASLAAQGSLKVNVFATFPFENAVDAFDLVEAGHTRGKVVIRLEDSAD